MAGLLDELLLMAQLLCCCRVELPPRELDMGEGACVLLSWPRTPEGPRNYSPSFWRTCISICISTGNVLPAICQNHVLKVRSHDGRATHAVALL